MFTGIVSQGKVISVSEGKIRLDITSLGEDPKIGDSVAVNGVCLTLVSLQSGIAEFDVMPETFRKTSLDSLRENDKVNIELPLKVCDRLGGHFVQGHIDGVGMIEKITEGNDVVVWISSTLSSQLIPKGSVTLDGVSMTVVDVQENKFSVAIIPHTLEITTLGSKKTGSKVNIEVDMIGKYVRKHLSQ